MQIAYQVRCFIYTFHEDRFVAEVKIFHYEVRKSGIPDSNWRRICTAAEKLHTMFKPLASKLGANIEIETLQQSSPRLAFHVGDSYFMSRRLWSKGEYTANPMPQTLTVEPLEDIFTRCLLLIVVHYAPKSTGLQIRSSGCVDGWMEAQTIVGALNLKNDLNQLIDDEDLAKGFDNPLPISGDDHLLGMAARVLESDSNAMAEKIKPLPPVQGIRWFF